MQMAYKWLHVCYFYSNFSFSSNFFLRASFSGLHKFHVTTIYRTDERRHKCPVEGCNKRYKNLQGARYHARQVHGYTEDNGANSAVSFDLTAVVPGQVAPLIQSGAPSKYAKFVILGEENIFPHRSEKLIKRSLFLHFPNFPTYFSI